MKYTESAPQNKKTFYFASILALLKVPVSGNMSDNYGNTFELAFLKGHGDKASCETQCALHIGFMVRSANKETHRDAEKRYWMLLHDAQLASPPNSHWFSDWVIRVTGNWI